MWRRSAQPPSLGSLALQLAATAVLFFFGWLLLGGSVGILIAYVAVNLIGVVIQALNTTTGNRADRAAIPGIARRAAAGIRDHRVGAPGPLAGRSKRSLRTRPLTRAHPLTGRSETG
jgi:hypothetical protein